MDFRMILALVGISAQVLFSGVSMAEDAAEKSKCEAFKLLDFSIIPDAPFRIAESEFVPGAGVLPDVCLMRGYVSPQVGFQAKFPTSDWNGKLLEIGSGGFAGSTQGGDEQAWCDFAVNKGYACIHSDHGHTSGVTGKSLALLDGVWAYNNLQAEVDYAFRGLHVVAVAQKEIAKRLYGREHDKAYFAGCSGGGRQAMVAAQKFPWDFDGIIAMEPAINLSGAFLTFLYNYASVIDDAGNPIFTDEALTNLHNAAVAKCDPEDGVTDGVISYPMSCAFDPADIECGEGEKSQCLTAEQVEAARAVYAGPKTSTGQKLYPGGVMPGGELGSFGFNVVRPLAQLALQDYFRYLAFQPDPGPKWDLEKNSFNFDEDYKRLSLMEALYDASNPDLRKFRDAGGKLIMVQGWEDAGTPFPLNSIDYYEAVQRSMGGAEATNQFARLFMVPGRSHCVGGAGAWSADFFSAMESWVEEGSAPDTITAYKPVMPFNPSASLSGPGEGKVEYSRPLFPYPKRSRYVGKGDVNDHSSFEPIR